MQKIISEFSELIKNLKQQKDLLGSKIFVVCGKRSIEMNEIHRLLEENFPLMYLSISQNSLQIQR